MDDVSPGKHLGRLEIVSLVQTGTGGQLFRARDTRDERDVGVRVLPADHGVEVRFNQRHYAIARLKHKNILPVRRLLSKPGISYIVTDEIRGISLRAVLKQGPLPVHEFINIARQIAAGLEAGHAAGIIHGELHPDSIFISPESVQIVDYGFSRTTAAAPNAFTKKGQDHIEYLSPEQLKGEEPTAPSDLFSFGAILYEMLVGQKAFRGQTPEERIQAVLEGMPEEPPARVPPPLVTLLERLLPLDRTQRYQTAEEVRIELEQLTSELADLQPAMSEPGTMPKPPRRSVLAPMLARLRHHAIALTLGAIAALAIGWSAAKLYTVSGNTHDVPHFVQVTRRRGSIVRSRFSGDGKTIVFTAQFEGAPLASYVKTAADTDERDLRLATGSTVLALSKQGDLAVRFLDGSLARIPLAGGNQEYLASGILDADWSPDGRQIAVTRYRGPGVPYQLEFPLGTVVYETRTAMEAVRVAPDGKQVAFTLFDGKERELWVGRTPSDAKRLLTLEKGQAQRGFAWSPDGREIWFGSIAPQERGLTMGVNLSGAKRYVNWMPGTYLDDVCRDKALVENLKTWSGLLVGPVDEEKTKGKTMDVSWHGEAVNLFLSATGKVIFTEYGERNGPNYGIFARDNATAPAVRIGDGDAVAMSPDGRWVTAFRPGATPEYMLLPVANPAAGKPIEIDKLKGKSAPVVGWLQNGDYLVWGSEPGLRARHWLFSPLSGGLRPVTPEGSPLGYISEDGDQILTGGSDHRPHIYTASSGTSRLAAGLQSLDRPLRWSPDGKSVYIASLEGGTQFVLYLVNMQTGVRARIKELQPGIQADTVVPRSLTPDGKVVAYSYVRTQSDLFEATGLK